MDRPLDTGPRRKFGVKFKSRKPERKKKEERNEKETRKKQERREKKKKRNRLKDRRGVAPSQEGA